MQDLAEQYEAYPYPLRIPEQESNTPAPTRMNLLEQLSHHLYDGKNVFKDKSFRALVAGGGTGDATLHIAHQLSRINPAAEIVHLDISYTSLEIAQKRAEKHKLENINFIHMSLLDLSADLHGKFDYINCSGVLHHLPSPEDGARALASVLKDDGAISIMLYGLYGRRGTYDVQNMIRQFRHQEDNLSDLIDLTKELLESFSDIRPLMKKVYETGLYSPNEIVDAFLHVRDRPYTVTDILKLLEASGLQLNTFVPLIFYDCLPALPEGELRERIAAMSAHDRFAFFELWSGQINKHFFYASKTTRKEYKTPDPNNLNLIPHATGRQNSHGHKLPKPYQQPLNIDQQHLLSQMDGQKTINELLEMSAKPLQKTKAALAKEWISLYDILHIRNQVALTQEPIL